MIVFPVCFNFHGNEQEALISENLMRVHIYKIRIHYSIYIVYILCRTDLQQNIQFSFTLDEVRCLFSDLSSATKILVTLLLTGFN